MKIAYILGSKDVDIWNYLHEITSMTTRNPAKISDKFQASFQTSNTQWSYREEAFGLTQGDNEITEQLEVCLTNVLLKCGYPLGIAVQPQS